LQVGNQVPTDFTTLEELWEWHLPLSAAENKFYGKYCCQHRMTINHAALLGNSSYRNCFHQKLFTICIEVNYIFKQVLAKSE
jgi:hypothetical protein